MCSGLAFNFVGEAHPHWRGQFALPSLPVQRLIASERTQRHAEQCLTRCLPPRTSQVDKKLTVTNAFPIPTSPISHGHVHTSPHRSHQSCSALALSKQRHTLRCFPVSENKFILQPRQPISFLPFPTCVSLVSSFTILKSGFKKIYKLNVLETIRCV